MQSCTVQTFTESEDTRCCVNTIFPPEDGHVGDNSVTNILLMNKENCALKLVDEIILKSCYCFHIWFDRMTSLGKIITTETSRRERKFLNMTIDYNKRNRTF